MQKRLIAILFIYSCTIQIFGARDDNLGIDNLFAHGSAIIKNGSKKILMPKPVVATTINIIKESFHPCITDQTETIQTITFDLTDRELHHIEEFLKLMYYAQHNLLKSHEIRRDLKRLCLNVSHDNFYRQLITSLNIFYSEYPDQKIITTQYLKALINHRPSPPANCADLLKIALGAFAVIPGVLLADLLGYDGYQEKIIVAFMAITMYAFVQAHDYWVQFELSLDDLKHLKRIS